MKKALGIVLFALSLAFAQESPSGREHAEAAAQHGEGHEGAQMPNEIWWKWANFAILAAGLGYLVSKHAGPYFRSRSEEIQRGIREAAEVRAEAEARAAAIEGKISNLSGEIEALRSGSREEIAAEGARVQAETEAQLRKVQAQAEAEIASSAKNASLELKAYSAQLALELAEQQIRQRLDAGKQEELADAFVKDLSQEKPANAARIQ